MSPLDPSQLDVRPAPSAPELAAIVAALAQVAANQTPPPAPEAPSRWRMAARRYE